MLFVPLHLNFDRIDDISAKPLLPLSRSVSAGECPIASAFPTDVNPLIEVSLPTLQTWDLKFSFDDLTKRNAEGEIDFDRKVKIALQELSAKHPFFKAGLTAITQYGYKFKLYNPSDNSLSDNVKRDFESSALAATFTRKSEIILKLQTQDIKGGITTKQQFVAVLANELTHAILNHSWVRYEEPGEAFKNLKQIVDNENAQKKELGHSEELLFEVAGDELLSRSVDEAIAMLYTNDSYTIRMSDFLSDEFKGKVLNYTLHVFEDMFGESVLNAVVSGKSPHPEIITDKELTTFKQRLTRNILDDSISKKIISQMKSWQFKFDQK